MKIKAKDQQSSYALKRLVGQKTGLLQRVEFGVRSRGGGNVIIARVAVSMDPEDIGIPHASADFAAIGKGTTKQEALQSAIGEYVERYCAFSSLSESAQSQASYEMITNDTLPVPSFSTIKHYITKQYNDIEVEPLSRDTKVMWIKGTDLITGEETALPSWLALSRNHSPHGFGSSNGCSAGQSLTGAVYRGLLEVVERDALMRYWYTQTVPKRIEYDCSALQRLQNICEPVNSRIDLLSLETDLPFNIVAATLVGESDSRPKFLISASARFHLKHAITDSLKELSQQIQMYQRYSLVNNDTVENDSRLSLGKNGIYYADPANFEVVKWLTTGDVITPELPDGHKMLSKIEKLNLAIKKFGQKSMNIVVYETTNIEIKEIGLYAVKVVVPELAPLCDPKKPAADHDRLPDTAVQREPHPIP